MPVPHASKIAAVSLALALGACTTEYAAPAVTEPIAITPQTEGALAAYLRTVKVTRPGAFAVSPDGRNSFYTYCDDIACATSNYSIPAQQGCRSLAGTPCVILYVRHEQRIAYKVDPNLPAGGRHDKQEQQPIDFDVNK